MENIDNNIIVNVKPYKVLLQTSEDGVEGGYYDADETWHEFGAGGTGIKNPLVTITLDNTSSSSNWFGGLYTIENSVWIYNEVQVESGSTDTFSLLSTSEDGETFFADVDTSNYVASNKVNIEYDEDMGRFVVTDPSLPASLTLTYFQID